MSAIAVARLAHGLGAEVTGVDIAGPLDADTVAAIRQAWLAHQVLVFRGQRLTPAQQIRFSGYFGPLDANQGLPHYRHPEHPEIFVITTKPVAGKPSETRHTGRAWHTDLSHTLNPAMGTLLHCLEKPPVGGDTVWANMYMAWETLSAPLRGFLETLSAVHDLSLVRDFARRDPRQVAEMYRLNPPVAQPVARRHPESGRTALFIAHRVGKFVGMSERESRPLLDFLLEHATQPEFCYRHRWREHDLVMWDNRCTLHIALQDYDINEARHMLRTTLTGAPSGRLYDAGADAAVAS